MNNKNLTREEFTGEQFFQHYLNLQISQYFNFLKKKERICWKCLPRSKIVASFLKKPNLYKNDQNHSKIIDIFERVFVLCECVNRKVKQKSVRSLFVACLKHNLQSPLLFLLKRIIKLFDILWFFPLMISCDP